METPGFVVVWPQSAILRPVSPPHGLVCAASLFGLRAGTEVFSLTINPSINPKYELTEATYFDII